MRPGLGLHRDGLVVRGDQRTRVGPRALDRLGQRQAAAAVAQESRQLFAAAGDVAAVARVQFLEAGILRGQGNVAAAKAIAEQILATGRETGDRRVVANVLSQLGIIQLQQKIRRTHTIAR